MNQHPNPWNQALVLRSVLLATGLEDAEIAFPVVTPGAGLQATCWVSDGLMESPELTPSLARDLQDAILAVQASMQGFAVRLQAGRLSIQEGDSGGFLVAWDATGDPDDETFSPLPARIEC
jgi:hypothetical protein